MIGKHLPEVGVGQQLHEELRGVAGRVAVGDVESCGARSEHAFAVPVLEDEARPGGRAVDGGVVVPVPVPVAAVVVRDDVVAEGGQVEVLRHQGVGGRVGQGGRAHRSGAGDVSVRCHVEHVVPGASCSRLDLETGGTVVVDVVVRLLAAEEVGGVGGVDVGHGVVDSPVQPVDEKLDPDARRVLGPQGRQGVAGPLIDDELRCWRRPTTSRR